MSNLSRLEAVSSSLDTAINKANSLPDAGSGSGGSIETVELTVHTSNDANAYYTSIENQSLVYKNTYINALIDTMITVIKNSSVSIRGPFSTLFSDLNISANGCEVLDGNGTCVIIGVYGETNGMARIDIASESNSGGSND